MKMFVKGFAFAGRGLWFCIRHERNFRFHMIAAAYVLAFAPYFSLSSAEWAVLLLTIAAVISAEAVNTAVEQTVDLLSPNSHPMARAAKDTAAGAVLVFAAASVCIGIVLFWDTAVLFLLWLEFTSVLWKGILFLLTVLLSLCFIAFGGVKKSRNHIKAKK